MATSSDTQALPQEPSGRPLPTQFISCHDPARVMDAALRSDVLQAHRAGTRAGPELEDVRWTLPR